jgi:hypothetical protein
MENSKRHCMRTRSTKQVRMVRVGTRSNVCKMMMSDRCEMCEDYTPVDREDETKCRRCSCVYGTVPERVNCDEFDPERDEDMFAMYEQESEQHVTVCARECAEIAARAIAAVEAMEATVDGQSDAEGHDALTSC